MKDEQVLLQLRSYVESTRPLIEALKITDNKNQLVKIMALNKIAEDFQAIFENGVEEKALQDAIKNGLSWIDSSGEKYDSEEEEEICESIIELMDIVGLESSDGHLNIWRYGFDPNQ